MIIRNAELKDTETILDLLKKTPELQGCGEIDALYSEGYVVDSIKDKKINLVLVAEQNTKVVGLLMAEIWKEKKYSFFVDFVVLPEYRSKGIGTKLYESYEKHCKKNGLKTIIGLVKTENSNMQRFCEKRGYKKGNKFYLYEKEI